MASEANASEREHAQPAQHTQTDEKERHTQTVEKERLIFQLRAALFSLFAS